MSNWSWKFKKTFFCFSNSIKGYSVKTSKEKLLIIYLNNNWRNSNNTAADNGNQIWIDDHQHIWEFKAKANVDYQNLTFDGDNLESKVGDYEITVSISNGKITKGDVLTDAENPTDGISFDIQFSDDTDNKTYTIKGYRKEES